MTWARRGWRDSTRSLLILFSCTCIYACPEQEKENPGMMSQREERKGKGKRGGDDWFSLKPSKSLSELSSSGLPSIWSTSNELQTHIASVSRKKPLKWWLPGEVLKRVQRTNPKGEPLPLELRALTPMNTKFNTFPVMLPSLLALFLLERSKEEQERVWSSTQRWSIYMSQRKGKNL